MDSWLNGQAGWRLLLIAWVQLCPGLMLFGAGSWDLFLSGTRTPGLAFPDVLAYAVVVAATLAPVVTRARRAQARRGKAVRRISTRETAGMVLLTGALLVQIAAQQSGNWRHIHRAVAAVTLPLMLAGFALAGMSMLRSRRSGRPSGPPGV